jgi:hypothetical protein
MKTTKIRTIVTRAVVAETIQGLEKTLHLECGHDNHCFELGTGIKAEQVVCHVCTRKAN